MTRHRWSVPETEVLQHVNERLEANDEGTDVLATIVAVEGNAYRRPGAKMLLDAGGTGVGAITAGCLEDDLLGRAEPVRESGQPELVTYDLTEGDDDVWGLGVGCNGIVDVLLEPLTETYRPAAEAFADGRDVAVCTVLDGGDDASLVRGDRAYYHPGVDRFEPVDGAVEEWPVATLAEPAADLAERANAAVFEVDHGGRSLEIFVDGLAAPPELVVFGTGHDVGPVTELAANTGFRVTVVGFRGGVDLEERFPDADRAITTSPRSLADALEVDDRTYAVVMTHNFVDDRLTVETLLESEIPYVGLMGPRERFAEMREEFTAEGQPVDDEALERLYTPIGLDLGSGSPYGIAHSIVAELLVVHNDRTPRHLGARAGPIHERAGTDADTN